MPIILTASTRSGHLQAEMVASTLQLPHELTPLWAELIYISIFHHGASRGNRTPIIRLEA